MKNRLFPVLLTLMSFIMISSTSVYAKHFASIPLSGTNGNCTFTGQFNVIDFSNAGTIDANGVLAGSIVDNRGTETTMDDITTMVNQALTVAVSLDGTTCSTLSLSSIEGFGVSSTCGNIPLSFNDATFTPDVSEGGKYNLITNSLCAIARYYDNGMKASQNSLFAHIKNLVRALQY